MSDPYNTILSIPAHVEPDMESVRDADLVIHGNMVIKDRYGSTPRPATPEELMRAHGVEPARQHDEIILDTGNAESEDYRPSLTISHNGSNELYVIVGEEAAGMAEGVPAETFQRIGDRILLTERIEKVLATLVKSGGGSVGIHFDPAKDGTEWSVMAMFGREAEDSPMAGGALHGIGSNVLDALDVK